MKISAKDEYACLAVLELALSYDPDVPVRVHDIAERQNIPVKFLFQIMQVLKRVDIVRSKRGTDGGYVLARPPSEITVGDVIQSISGPFVQHPGSENGARRDTSEQFRTIWQNVDSAIGSVLNHISFAQLVNQVRKRDRQVMYHI